MSEGLSGEMSPANELSSFSKQFDAKDEDITSIFDSLTLSLSRSAPSYTDVDLEHGRKLGPGKCASED